MNNDKTIKVLNFLVIVIIFFLIISNLLILEVNWDAAYYLSVAKEIYTGKVFFVDIGSSYNPLSIITLGLPYLITNDPSYLWHLLINFVIIGVSGFVFFKLLPNSNNVKQNIFYSLFFILGSLMLDGNKLLLEPLSVFFQLLSIFFYLKKKRTFYIILTGLLISLAFLSKQYGIFIIAPIFLDIFFSKTNVFKKISFLSVGISIPLIIFFVYLNSYGITFQQYIMDLLGKNIIFDVGNGTGRGFNLYSYFRGSLVFISFNLYLFLLPIYIFKTSKINYFYFVSFIVSLSPLYFAGYRHYFQYILPYSMLYYIGLSLNFDNLKKKYSIYLFTFSIVIISIYSIIIFNRQLNNINKIEISKNIILSHISKGSNVYLDGLPPVFYYKCKYKSIDLKNISFSFAGFFKPKTISKYLDKGEFIVISKSKYNDYAKYLGQHSKDEFKIDNLTFLAITKE